MSVNEVTPWTPRDSKGRFAPDRHARHLCDAECQLEAIREAEWVKRQEEAKA